MDRKNILGTILTILGSGGLVYAAVWFANSLEGANNTNAIIGIGVISFVFFMAGINFANASKKSA